MTLLGQDVLAEAGKRNKPLRSKLLEWEILVCGSDWHCLADVRRSFPATDGVTLGSRTVVTIFNIKGNEYRLLSSIDYENASVDVLAMMTHAEYDKNLWKASF